ncbi:MAG: SelB C-terminal domain-containing protein [Planctomycetota bacterium]|nr:SelB C-terminal domain-containing protein [Planctomycetota bacterium]
MEAAFAAGGLAPPSPRDVEAQLKINPKTLREIMKYLLDTGSLVEAAPEIVFHQRSYENAKAEVRKLFAGKPELTTSEIRQHLGMNRKYVVPLVELFDRKGLTVRIGDKRKLKTEGSSQ